MLGTAACLPRNDHRFVRDRFDGLFGDIGASDVVINVGSRTIQEVVTQQ